MKRKHNYKELSVWQKSRKFVSEVYTITKNFPKDEMFCLTQQMRRSAISIPSNIAEGFGRGTDAQINQFLDIAQGSAFELETQLYLSFDLNYVQKDQIEALISNLDEIKKMIEALQNRFTKI